MDLRLEQSLVHMHIDVLLQSRLFQNFKSVVIHTRMFRVHNPGTWKKKEREKENNHEPVRSTY